jgi:hypothetical protein
MSHFSFAISYITRGNVLELSFFVEGVTLRVTPSTKNDRLLLPALNSFKAIHEWLGSPEKPKSERLSDGKGVNIV